MMRRIFIVLGILGCACAALNAAQPRTLVFLSDFGVKDSAVAVCKGVMWKIKPDLRIVDLTHEVPPYDVAAAGRLLEQTLPFYPEGTVFVAVIDPGVGSTRKSIAVRTKQGRFLVGPDNGLFAAAIALEGLDKAVELSNPDFFIPNKLSTTFHGRDIFSPVGAHLAAGVALEKLGPDLAALTDLPAKAAALKNGVLAGEISYIEDPYGNVVTNIPRELMEKAGIKMGDRLILAAAGEEIALPLKFTFSDVPVGKELAVYHSRGALSFSVNQGDFARVHGLKARQNISVRKAGR